MYDAVIIGGGPAGLTALLYAGRAGLRAALFERAFPGGQMTTTTRIENYPGFAEGIDGMALAQAMEAQARATGAEVRYDEILRLSRDDADDAYAVHLRSETLKTRALVLCMGATPKKLGIADEERLTGAGISYCATCDGAFFKGKSVAVIGGGDTAAEDALYLARNGSDVHLIHRRDRLRAQAHLARRVQETPGITVHWNAAAEALIGQQRLTALTLRDTRDGALSQLEVEGAFVAIGTQPQTALAQELVTLDASGYVVAGEDTRTSARRVYAAGDLRTKPLRQVATAVGDGAVAIWALLEDL